MIIIHLRVSDSQVVDRATPRRRTAGFRLFHPEVGHLTQINACVFALRHSQNGYVVCAGYLPAAD
ncbi:hypothetical protein [Caballeronia arationis]|uniref:hypothetical protein n=1 Tax=Caballeronia arationis TaxID=1777142 RepID=UPI000A84163B|nr:hypothetical protein [Caballeronia arationis]